MLDFATCFDVNYLSRGLALLKSLQKHSSVPFRFHILALDEEVSRYFENHPIAGVYVIPLAVLESHFPELEAAKNNRSIIEYYFTLSPYLPLYLLNNIPDIEQITTMDADLYFFNDPALILGRYKDASILITPHNFSDRLQDLLVFGRYNVSFQSFKNNADGRLCLEQWRQSCLVWCYDKLDEENSRFADQKYLDSWPQEFKGVQEINMPGAGLAPWNIDRYNYRLDHGKVLVNDEPIIYYHFHQLRIFNRYFALNGFNHYKVVTKYKVLKRIYHPYLKVLNSLSSQLNADSGTLRYNGQLQGGIKQKLKNPHGYWLFNNYYIFHVNPHRWFTAIKRLLNFSYGSTNYPGNACQ